MNPAGVSHIVEAEITIQGSARKIFEALTNPAQLVKWWSVEGRFQMTQVESDLRPGGKWTMRGNGMGRPVQVTGRYVDVDPPRLLVMTWLPSWQGDATESTVRWELDETNGVTTVRLTHSGLATETARNSHNGWTQILGALQAYVEDYN